MRIMDRGTKAEKRLVEAAQRRSRQRRSDTDDPFARPWDPPACEPDLRGPNSGVGSTGSPPGSIISIVGTSRRPSPAAGPPTPTSPTTSPPLPAGATSPASARALMPSKEWHRLVLPAFLDRLNRALGPTGCTPGQQRMASGAAYKDFSAPAAREHRLEMLTNDATLPSTATIMSEPS